MNIVDAYGERKKQQVMQSTFGHLAPKEGKTYKGTMIYVHGEFGDIVLLAADFKKLNDSPWLYGAMADYLSEHCEAEGIYKWTGQMTKENDHYFFGGKIERMDFKNIF